MSVLRVLNLSKAFGGVHAVENVSFEVGEGEFLALIGPNGAGKSTCFNMINGQLAPDAGDIEFAGRSIAGWKPRDIWRLGVGRTFQVAATFGSMTVAENVQMALISHHGEIFRFGAALASRHRDMAIELLEQVGMDRSAARACKELAYGDVKRVELAIVVFGYADRIIVLARGIVIAEGDAKVIRDNPQVQQVYLGTGRTFTPHVEGRV
ncbi:MAG: ATP-binding cassette domain-containing protein [Alphaproteobacteria bacterium]|nr:MAG: ATP-binding cassette domain-containing protein [Alphaproteobacteria bacterium]